MLRKLELEFFLIGLLAAVAATFPLVSYITTHLPGSELVGPYSHCWKFWWTCHALTDLWTNPAYCSYINYPVGLAVGFHMANFMDGIWAIPFTFLLGPVAGINAVVLLSIASGCWAASLLAREMGLSKAQAVLVGLTWSLCPHHLGFLMGGAIEYMANPWVPLYFLALMRLLRPRLASSPGRRAIAAVGLALCIFLTAMTTWFSGAVLAIFGGMLLVVLVVHHRFRVLPQAAWALCGMVAGGIAVLFAARWLLPMMEKSPAQIGIENARVLLLQRSVIRGWSEATIAQSEFLWINNHLMISLCLLALLGCLHRWGRRCLLLGIPFYLDLLIPHSWVIEIKAPFLAKYPSLVSVGNLVGLRAESRIFLLHLVLALAAGFGMAWLQQRLARCTWRRLVGFLPLAALAAWGIEMVLVCPVKLPVSTFHARIPPHARFLETAEKGAVIDVPLAVSGQSEYLFKAIHSKYLYYQTAHRHPIVAAVGSRLMHSEEDVPISDAARDLFLYPLPTSDYRLPSGWTPRRLHKAGFRWVVLHRWLIPMGYKRKVIGGLRGAFGAPRSFEGGRVQVFRIPER